MEKSKTFKHGPLVTRSEYEAAISVLNQAYANGQIKKYGPHFKLIDFLVPKEAVKAFKDKDQLREEAMENIRRLEDRIKPALAAIEQAKNTLVQLGGIPGVTHINTVTGTLSFGVSVQQTPPNEEFAAWTHMSMECEAEEEVARASRTNSQVARERDTQCSCKYDGYKFHTGDCAANKSGPCS